MSNSFDAGSSSDDDLLASPVFRRRDRRADRADRTKLDFLETCLRGSDARTDVQRRIAEVDCGLGIGVGGAGGTGGSGSAVASSGGAGIEREEEEEGAPPPDPCGDGPGGEEGSGGGGAVGGGAAVGCPNDGFPGGGDDGGCKEHVQNNAPSASANAGETGSDRPPSAATAASATAASATAASATAVKSEPTSNKNDEDAYWARIDSFAEENAYKTPNGGISRNGRGGRVPGSRGWRVRDAHSARRRLDDAISGLDGYASDLTDDGGGKWKDGVCGMTRERMRSEAEARSQGSSSRLGLRKMFRRPPAVGGGGGAFVNRREAADGLRSIAASLRSSHRAPRTASARVLRRTFVDPLVAITTRSREPPDAWDCIHRFLLNNAVLSGKFAIALPGSFCEWLWKMAQSPFDAGGHCPATCCNLIRKFLVRRMDVCDSDDDVSKSFRVELSFLKNYCMDDLVSCLVDDFGLWLEHGPMHTLEENDDGNRDTARISNDDNDDNRSIRVDVSALKNTFLIWSALFDRNLILIRETEEGGDALFGEDASRVLVAFARVGLDPSFNEADENCDTCGEPLLALIQKLTGSLIATVTHQISKRFDGGEHAGRWMTHTADLMVKACGDLSAGDEDAADSDDTRGDLALAMAVKRMCSYTLDAGFILDIALMKMMFAERALHKCLTEIVDWEDKVKERTPPANKNLQHAMHALVTAEVGFQWIEEHSESLMYSHPRFLAAVLIAGECATIGAGVCWRTQNDSQSEDEPVKITEVSDAVHEIVSNIEDLCDGLKKECRAVIAYPHLRRTKEYLTRLIKELGALKGKSSKDNGRKRREQGSLDTYFSRPSLS